jgi:hypothetical protein
MIDLDKLLELEAKASAAPWECFEDIEPGLKIDWPRGYMRGYDINFVSTMRNNFKDLCLELKATRKVVEAARVEAMFWNEELCKRSEYEQKEAAIQRLETALKDLDEATGREK